MPRDNLAADLRFLLEEKEVPDTLQDAFADQGYTTVCRFALLDDNRANVRAALTRDFGLDPAAQAPEVGREARLNIVKVIDAWETACRRSEEDRKQEAEAKSSRLPKIIGKAAHLSMRRAAQELHGELEDRVAPGASLVEHVMEMIEEANMEALPLTAVLSVEDGDDAKVGAVVDTSGVFRLKRGKTEISMPGDPESFRKRMRTLAFAYVYARLRHPGRAAFRSATVEIFAEYVEYILGDHVRGLVAKDATGAVISKPSWAQVLHYDYQVRKEQAKLINFGKTFAVALKDAWNDTALRDRHFVTQVAVSAAVSAPAEARSRSPRGGYQETPRGRRGSRGALQGSPGGKSKGGKGSKS